MYRRILAVALLLAGFWCLGQQEGRSQLIGEGVWKKPGGGSSCAGFTINGAATNAPTPGAATTTRTITTTSPNEIIFSIILTNGISVTGTSDTAGLSWTTARAVAGSAIYESWALSTGTLSGDTITTTYSGSTIFVETIVFGVIGAHIASPFDSGGASNVPQTTGGTAASVVTNNPNTLLLGFSRNAGYAGAAAGFTSVIPANFMLAEYKALVAAGTNSVTDPDTSNGLIGDALVCGP